MKKILFILLTSMVSLYSTAGDPKYMAVMERNVAMIDTATTTTTYSVANNTFERIANANPTEWLPVYYQAYCTILMGMKQESPALKDEYFDKAEALINRADEISPENSEILVVQAWVNSMKIGVDPATRGQKLGPKAGMFTEKALQLNPENPRAHFLKGTSIFYMPANFGGGKDKALPVFEKAIEKFKAAKPENKIVPHWGQVPAEALLEQCKKAE